MKLKIIMLLMLLGVGFNAFPQFVGDAAPVSSANPIKTNKPSFTLKIGLAMPSGNMGIAPSNGTTPKYTEGYMGAKTGFFAEVGFGLNMIKPEKKVSFYYYPLLVAFWKTNLDWSGNNDPIFDKKEVYLTLKRFRNSPEIWNRIQTNGPNAGGTVLQAGLIDTFDF